MADGGGDRAYLAFCRRISEGDAEWRAISGTFAACGQRCQRCNVRPLRYIFHVSLDAFYTFLADDGWAIASHIALSTLMAMFPFLIVLTSLAGFFGSKELADEAAALLLQTWPRQVADAIAGQIHEVLTTTRTDLLTVGAVLAIYF